MSAISVPPGWHASAPRDGQPAVELRLHSEWWHLVFLTPTGYQVVLGPIGIDLGTHPSLEEAVRCAEDNARTRALNGLHSAQREIRRSATVLKHLSALRAESAPSTGPADAREARP